MAKFVILGNPKIFKRMNIGFFAEHGIIFAEIFCIKAEFIIFAPEKLSTGGLYPVAGA